MSSHNFCRSREKRNALWRSVAFSGVQCSVLAAAILVVSCQAQTTAEIPSYQSEPAQPASIYDPDPNHLWNRLFVTFYRQKVSSYVAGQMGKTVTNWVGPDVLDPPLGYHPRFLLDDEPFAKCDAILDEFLNQQGAKLIHDPLKRALLQRDLWAVFDVLAEADFFPRTNSIGTGTPPTTSQEQHRIVLERKIAQVIRSLALSRAEIESLPDTYSAAVRSDPFSGKQKSSYNFLPPDLFATNSTWFEIQPGDRPLDHTFMVGGRSVFRAFVKSPAGFTNALGDHIRDLERWRLQDRAWAQLQQTNRAAARKTEPQRPSGKLPFGTQLLLLREMICLDENLQMVPTHVVESVQFRTAPSVFQSQSFGEAELSRGLLFQGKQGGLRPVPAGEPRFAAYDNLGHLAVDDKGNTLPLGATPQNCAGCHQTSRLFSNPKASSKPARSTSIESIRQRKEKRGKLDQLRELILSPATNEK